MAQGDDAVVGGYFDVPIGDQDIKGCREGDAQGSLGRPGSRCQLFGAGADPPPHQSLRFTPAQHRGGGGRGRGRWPGGRRRGGGGGRNGPSERDRPDGHHVVASTGAREDGAQQHQHDEHGHAPCSGDFHTTPCRLLMTLCHAASWHQAINCRVCDISELVRHHPQHQNGRPRHEQGHPEGEVGGHPFGRGGGPQVHDSNDPQVIIC